MVENATLEDITFDDDTTYQLIFRCIYPKILEKLENFILQNSHVKIVKIFIAIFSYKMHFP